MKKMFFYAAALFMTAVGFTACTAEDEVFPPAVVNIAEEEVEVSAQGGAVTLNLTAPSDVVYSVQTPEWIALNEDGIVARGVNSSNTLNFSVAPTQTCQERTGVIRIVTNNGLQDSLVVVQAGLELAVDKTQAGAPSAGGILTVVLTATPGYTVDMPSWITMQEDPATTHVGVQTAEVNFVIAKNTAAAAREGEIVITCGDACGKEVKIAVKQQPGLDLTKMVSYSGKWVSLEYAGDEYDATFGLVWDETDPTKVTVCNFDPYFAANGATVDQGFNFVEGQYIAEENAIYIPVMSSLNVMMEHPEYGLMDFYTGALNAEGTQYVDLYLVLNEDKSAITFPTAVCTLLLVDGEFGGHYDIYSAVGAFTKVAE
jgi:hypothetical protein